MHLNNSMACDYEQTKYIIKQGNVTSINSKDLGSECNLLGFYKNRSVFECTDVKLNSEPKQENENNIMRRGTESNLGSKQIIIKPIASSGDIVLINDKNVKIAVRKCTNVPTNILNMLNKKSTSTGNVTNVNSEPDQHFTVTKGIRTYTKKKDKAYQNGNIDNGIPKPNSNFKTCSIIKEIVDRRTSDCDKNDVGKIEINKSARDTFVDGVNAHTDPAETCLIGPNDFICSKHPTVDQKAIHSVEFTKGLLKQKQIPEEIIKAPSKFISVKNFIKNKVILEDKVTILNHSSEIIDLTADVNERVCKKLEDKVEAANLVLDKLDKPLGNVAYKGDSIKFKIKHVIANKQQETRVCKTDMGKIKHFKEKSSSEENLKFKPVIYVRKGESNGRDDRIVAQMGEPMSVPEYQTTTHFISSNFYDYDQSASNITVVTNEDENNVYCDWMGNGSRDDGDILEKTTCINNTCGSGKNIERRINVPGSSYNKIDGMSLSYGGNWHTPELIVNRIPSHNETRSITPQRLRNKRFQHDKTVKKQMFIRQEIDRYLKCRRKRPKQKKTLTNAASQTELNLTDSSTQTEIHQQPSPEPSSLDMNHMDEILEEQLDGCTNIIGNNVNFGVGPIMSPYVKSGGNGVTFTMGNNLEAVHNEQCMNVFPSPMGSDNMGFAIVNVNGGVKSELNDKQRFYEYLKGCSMQDSIGNMPIHLEVMNHNLSEVKKQALMLGIRNLSIDLPNNNHLTPLHLAIIHNCEEALVKFLLDRDADLECMDPDGNNAIHLAVFYNANNLLRVLLQKANNINFNLNTFNYEGFTPLLLATLEDKYEMVSIFLDYGADANVRDQKSGRTPLFHAVENNNLKMVRLLLKNNANKKIKNFSGTSAHDAVFELEEINPEIKNTIIGIKDIAAFNSPRIEKRKRNVDKTKYTGPKKLKTVKTYRKIQMK